MRKLIPNLKMQRANQLLDAWLRGMNQAGHDVTGEDIATVFKASVAQSAAEEVTRAEVLKEARDWWGPKAYATEPYTHGPWRCQVGCEGRTTGFGNTWEAAFEDARQRERQATAAIDRREAVKQDIGEARLRGDQ